MSTTFTFDLHLSGAGAGASAAAALRHGTVSIASPSDAQQGKKRVIETPGCLMFSTKGSVPHLTPDTMRLQDFGGINVSLEQLLHPDQPTSFSKWPLTSPFNSGSKFTLAEYLHLQDMILMCDLRDYSSFSAFASPSDAAAAAGAASSKLVGPNTDRYALLSTPKGVRQLTVDDYLQIVRQYRPDIMVAMADSIVEKSKNPEHKGPAEKRVRKSVERSLKWLDQILLEREGQDGRMEDRRMEEEKKRRRERKEKKRAAAAMMAEQQQQQEQQEGGAEQQQQAFSKDTMSEVAESDDTPIAIVPRETEPWKEVAVFAHVLGSHIEAERITSAQETARRAGAPPTSAPASRSDPCRPSPSTRSYR